jgi:hypothetical protein
MAKVNIKYRVHGVDSERGWGREYWHVDFDTRAKAEKFMADTNAKNTAQFAPDFYSQANSIELIEA